MALVLSFEICQESNCSGLSFKELTGTYLSPSNIYGWGGLNPATATATAATLTITIGTTPYIINLFPTFPTTNTGFVFNIPNTSIGLLSGDKLPDQIITFTYSVTIGAGPAAVVYTQTITQAFFCQANCCVNSMFLNLNFECDSCNENIDEALKAHAMLLGLKYSANCGNSTEFNNTLEQLNKLCNNTNCSSCK